MNDYLVRVVSREAHVRGIACVTTHLAEKARRRHGASPTASAALARALTGGALFGALLKDNQRLALKFEGSGPIGTVIVEADREGTVVGKMANPAADAPLREGKLDVAGVMGREGLLTVVKDLRLKEPYTGAVNFRSGEIGDDLAYYLTESEQIPSAVGLGVELCSDGGVKVSGGFLIQSLPSLKEADVDSIITNIGRLPSLSKFFAEGKAPEDILENLFQGVPCDVLFKTELSYSCPCSRDKVERVLLTMGSKELERLRDKNERTEVVCDFCKKPYYFQHKDFSAIISRHF